MIGSGILLLFCVPLGWFFLLRNDDVGETTVKVHQPDPVYENVDVEMCDINSELESARGEAASTRSSIYAPAPRALQEEASGNGNDRYGKVSAISNARVEYGQRPIGKKGDHYLPIEEVVQQ